MDDDIFFAGVTGQAAAIRDGEISSRELVSATLERIQRYDGRLNAFTQVLAEQALEEATERDKAADADRGPLHGVPIAIKEEIDVAGVVTSFGGRANVTPAAADSEVVRRLRAAGAVVVGKTNMPEFGQMPFTESLAHGTTRNPWDRTRSPGGSSGGTAAAVAAGLVPAAMGGDGGGSIRIPSAFCGLYGLKPQRGRVSSHPQPHLWWSLGTVGPLTRTVLDSAVIYDVIRGSVPGDRYRADEPRVSFEQAVRTEIGPLRIGWSTKPVTPSIRPDPEHVQVVKDTAEALSRLGHHVEEVDPHYPDPTAAYFPQYLGSIRTEVELVERPELLERRTLQSARLGAWVRPGVLEWAMRQGERLAAKANRVFDDHDLLLTPTTPNRPPEIGVLDGLGTVRAVLKALPVVNYAALWNVTGNPAASVPTGFGRDGLPTAVQLVGRPNDEVTILAVSAQLEQAQPWAHARPSL